MKLTVMKIAIHPADKSPCCDEGVLYLELIDEGAGAFLELSQDGSRISIDPEEIDAISSAAKQLMQGVGEK